MKLSRDQLWDIANIDEKYLIGFIDKKSNFDANKLSVLISFAKEQASSHLEILNDQKRLRGINEAIKNG